MKIPRFLFFLSFLVFSCSGDDTVQNNNPYLFSPVVNAQLNLSLPQYNPLNFPGNSIILNNQGIKGIVVYNVDNSQYTAFELSDPNHVPAECSRMEINGIEAACPCPSDAHKYNIVTGQHSTQPNLYPMQRYRAVRSGDVIQITN